MAGSALLRRRGTRRVDGFRVTLLIGLVFALLVSALVLGMLLGTHILSGSTPTASDGSKIGVHNLIRGGKTMEEINELIHLQNMKHHGDDDQTTPQQAKPLVVRGGDDDNNEEEEEFLGEEAADAASGRVDDDDKLYPYSLDKVSERYDFKSWKAKGGKRFEEYKDGGTPWLVTDDILQKSDDCARSRRYHVKKAMEHAWGGYESTAFGKDEVLPETGGGNNNWGNTGTTLVDSLDTLWLMDMKDEFWRARDWVRDYLDYSRVGMVSAFETTIRSLGGLLSAYDWSGDKVFLDKAQDLGSRLFKVFDSPSGLPFGQVALNTGKVTNIAWTGGNAILSEMGTLQLEFRYLAKAVDKPEYAEKSEKVFEILNDMHNTNGLYPYYVRNRQDIPTFANDKLTFGAMSDSLYEYMLKIWLQGGRKEPLYRDMYDRAMDGMHSQLLQTSTPSGLTYIADKNSGNLDHKMDHLVCFMGGLLALGAYTDPKGLDSHRAKRDLKTAKALTYTCYQMYARMATGISPEFIQFHPDKDFDIGRGAPHYLLRPEAVESFYILNFLTGDPIYREWGWEVFSAIERHCRTKVAYGQLHDVRLVEAAPSNKMESFFLAETLKYLYLLQDPDSSVDILKKHVFNTEAHPVRIFPIIEKETS